MSESAERCAVCKEPVYVLEHKSWSMLYDHDFVVEAIDPNAICYHNTPDCRGHGDF